MSIRIATDIGGTFTDLVYLSEGRIRAVKADTTPPHFHLGLLNAVELAGIDLREVDFFAHGSTIVINTLTERKGAKTALLTTAGFRDVLEIARGNTPDIFNPRYRKPPPFVPRELRREVRERISHDGRVIEPLSLVGLAETLAQLRAEGVTAIAICLLHAYREPQHERLLKAAVQALWPEVAIVASHEVSRVWREYERCSTTVLSAYVMPAASHYLNYLGSSLRERGLAESPFIMKSNGGIATLAAACGDPISLVESGPVSGILGAQVYGALIGEKQLIALDIGGTTAKCSLIEDGRVSITNDYVIERSPTSAGYPIMTPVVDIVEIGNGGGSIAWLDAAGSLRVGPQSAGSTPGPVAYGRGGTAPTTTDANLFTGRINPKGFAGGTIEPDLAAVRQAFEKIGAQLGLDGMAVAHGVLQIANANMVNALKLVSVNRGHDPRDFALIAFGGGGALHASALAAELGIPKVIIPPYAGVFSAWGMLMLDVRRDLIRTVVQPLNEAGSGELAKVFCELEQEALAAFAVDGFAPGLVRFERYVDARYIGQEHAVKIALANELVHVADTLERFHRSHENAYSFRLDGDVEIVGLHLAAFGTVPKSPIHPLPDAQDSSAAPALDGERGVELQPGRGQVVPVYSRERLLPGMRLRGPAIIEEPTTTTVVGAGERVEIDRFGGLHIHLPSA